MQHSNCFCQVAEHLPHDSRNSKSPQLFSIMEVKREVRRVRRRVKRRRLPLVPVNTVEVISSDENESSEDVTDNVVPPPASFSPRDAPPVSTVSQSLHTFGGSSSSTQPSPVQNSFGGSGSSTQPPPEHNVPISAEEAKSRGFDKSDVDLFFQPENEDKVLKFRMRPEFLKWQVTYANYACNGCPKQFDNSGSYYQHLDSASKCVAALAFQREGYLLKHGYFMIPSGFKET